MTNDVRAVSAWMMDTAAAWFDAATVQRVFQPMVADWQRQCVAKARAARLICVAQGVGAFAVSFLLLLSADVRRPLPTGLAAKATWFIGVFTLIGVVVMVSPFYLEDVRVSGWLLLGSLVTSSLAFAIPAALTPATILLVTRTKWSSSEVRRGAVRMALVTTVAVMALAGWLTPYSNQRARAEMAAQVGRSAPLPGVREQSLPELLRSARETEIRTGHLTGRQREINTRATLIFLPVTVSILGLAVARKRKWSLWNASFWWLAVPATVIMLPGWRSHGVLLTIAAAAHWLAGRRTAAPRAGTVVV